MVFSILMLGMFLFRLNYLFVGSILLFIQAILLVSWRTGSFIRKYESIVVDGDVLLIPGRSGKIKINHLQKSRLEENNKVVLNFGDHGTVEAHLKHGLATKFLDRCEIRLADRVNCLPIIYQRVPSSRGFLVSMFALLILLEGASFPGLMKHGFSIDPSIQWDMRIFFLVSAASIAMILCLIKESKVEVSRRGIRIVRLGFPVFIHFDEVVDLEFISSMIGPENPEVTVILRSSREFSINPVKLEHVPFLRLAIRLVVLDREKEAASVRSICCPLERGSVPVKEWLASLRKHYGGAPGYCKERLSEDELEAWLLNVSTPPSARLGAAVALQASSDGAKKRLQAAAARCENPALAKALAAVREDRLDEALVSTVEQQSVRTSESG